MSATREAFDDMVVAESRAWIAASVVIVGDRSEAEEVVQDVLGRAFQRWHDVGEMDRPGAWVRRSVINESITIWRRHDAERRAMDRMHARPAVANDSDDLPDPELWAAVRSLPESQCRAIALHYGADLALADVARELELTESATKTLLYRARRTLRDLLSETRNTHD